MIAELGHLCLWLALMVACIQIIAPTIGLIYKNQQLINVANSSAFAQFLLVSGSFAALTWSYWVSDFSVLNVLENSHTLKPPLYKITGVWANHEGSLLLWVLMLSLAGAAVAAFAPTAQRAFQARVLAIQASIAVGFYAFLLFASNPFARVMPAPVQGQGLNPILQDPGLAFHPPMLYLGYVGLSVAFSFAVAALIDDRVGPQWARMARPWVLLAWSALTCGLALGSWWAYYELGWGGYWFWDPVENAALMPWLAATALLHSIVVLEKRDALRSWTVLLAVVAFSLSMLGTFIVRSGVLTSVHAFAVDPERGIFILILLAIYIGGALSLFAWRAGTVKAGDTFALLSREGALVANNLFLSAALGTVFIGTLYPLILEALTDDKISVGPPYFQATFTPLMAALAVLIGVGPLLSWRKSQESRVVQQLMIPAGLALLIGLAFLAFASPPAVWSAIGFGLAAWLVITVVWECLGSAGLRGGVRIALQRIRRRPRAAWGMSVAHMGVAVTLFGITASGAWQKEALTITTIGQPISVGSFVFRLTDVEPVAGANFTALEGRFDVSQEGRVIASMRPQARTYITPPMETTESAIHPLLGGDLYAVLGKPDGKGGWQVRLHWKPFIAWIWYGAALMALGGGLALSDGRGRKALKKEVQ